MKRDERVQYDITWEAANVSTLWSAKIDKYEWLAGKEILPPDQSILGKRARFTYSLLWKKVRTIEKQE